MELAYTSIKNPELKFSKHKRFFDCKQSIWNGGAAKLVKQGPSCILQLKHDYRYRDSSDHTNQFLKGRQSDTCPGKILVALVTHTYIATMQCPILSLSFIKGKI